MGRKPLSGERKSDRTLRIRLTDAERTMIDAAAASKNQKASTWAREVLIRQARK